MMEEIRVLGTGHAVVFDCYNTCFALKHQEEFFLVDAGGGSQILTQLKKMDISFNHIHYFFISHTHTDHITGAIWVLRMIGSGILGGRYEGNLNIYGCDLVIQCIESMYRYMLGPKFENLINTRIIFHVVEDGQKEDILDEEVTFFDIHSTKMKQFGFTLKNTKLIFAGDEPYNEICDQYTKGMKILLHEAFCLYSMRNIYHPYEIHHSTPIDAGKLAKRLNVEKLVLWHTEDQSYETKKITYKEEAESVFDGEVIVPQDLEVIKL